MTKPNDERIAEIEALWSNDRQTVMDHIPDLLSEVKALRVEKAQAEAERDVLINFLVDARRQEQTRTERGDYSAMCPNAVLMTPSGDFDWLKYAQQQTEKQGEQE